jgi:flagellar hook-associated protein 3 FlgL
LTDYDTVSVGKLVNFQNAVSQKSAFISSINTVQTRLTLYDTTLSDIEKIASQSNNLASQNQNYEPSKLAGLQAQANSLLRQLTDDLNQKSSDRYIFSGARYSTAPVKDLSALTTTPSVTTTTTPNLPEYDTGYTLGGANTNANAYTQDSAVVNTGYNISYGVTSNDTALQQLVAGLRFIKEATNATNAAAYQSNMTQASTLLGNALSGVQTIHSTVAGNQNTLKTLKDQLTSQNETLTGQISDIQQVDLTEVGTKINFLKTQLEASYSATSTTLNLSILKYL